MRVSSLVSIFGILAAVWRAVAQDSLPDSGVQTSRPMCSKPTYRKEWRMLSAKEQRAFIDAVKCLGELPHDPKLAPTGDTPGIAPLNTSSFHYDDFVYAHMDVNVKVHFTGLFLPWYRWLLHTFLGALKEKCHYHGELPYWNWTLDVQNVTASPVFNANKTHGLGMIGVAEANYTVSDGAFASSVRAYPTPHRVARHFDLYPFKLKTFPFDFNKPDMPATDALSPEAIEGLVDGSAGNYTDFGYKLDGERAQGPHNAAHLMMGGDLSSPLWSPNDPLFYLHHAMLDCIWAKWQNRRPENAKAYGGGLTMDLNNYDAYPVGAPPTANKSSILPTVGLTRPVAVWEVFSTKSEYLCYKCIW
ncbi:hypothetical protein CTheo_6533 [Ceratobasidium theobromae]|uniref:Tyrosinase copper-binding domain-containing protein n=1 Tax=Ceratobasidium theobromae TaxID=1582974 RepID=A0A5N5QEZ6_9AGAM|nr:hypothetical protein CTheo_6533 [Ceratobasidium theobromae]